MLEDPNVRRGGGPMTDDPSAPLPDGKHLLEHGLTGNERFC